MRETFSDQTSSAVVGTCARVTPVPQAAVGPLSSDDVHPVPAPAPSPATTPAGPITVYASFSTARVAYFNATARETWSSLTAGVVVPLGTNAALTLESAPEWRADVLDARTSVQVDARLSPRLSGYLQVAATPKSHFKEIWSVTGGLDRTLTRSFGLAIDGRVATYYTGTFVSVSPSVRFNPPKLPIELSGKWINLWNAQGHHDIGWAARVAYDFKQVNSIIIGAADYPDSEAGQAGRVRSLYAAAIVQLSRRATMRLTVDQDTRQFSYRRTGITLSVSWKLGPSGAR